jgi:hypothetical protein
MKLRRAFSRFASAAPGFNRSTGDVTPFRLLQGAALRSMAVTVHHPRPTPRGGAIVHSETNVPVKAAGVCIGIKERVGCPCHTAGELRHARWTGRRLSCRANSGHGRATTHAYAFGDANHLPVDIISYIVSQMPTFTEQTCSDRTVSLSTLGMCSDSAGLTSAQNFSDPNRKEICR